MLREDLSHVTSCCQVRQDPSHLPGSLNSLKGVAVLLFARMQRVPLGCLFLTIFTSGEKGGCLFTSQVIQLFLPISISGEEEAIYHNNTLTFFQEREWIETTERLVSLEGTISKEWEIPLSSHSQESFLLV